MVNSSLRCDRLEGCGKLMWLDVSSVDMGWRQICGVSREVHDTRFLRKWGSLSGSTAAKATKGGWRGGNVADWAKYVGRGLGP